MQQKQSFWKKLFCVCEDEDSIMASKQASKSMEQNPSLKHQHYTENKNLTPQKVESQLGLSLQSEYFYPEIIGDNEFVLNKSHELCIYQKNSSIDFKYPQKPYWVEPTNIFELYYSRQLQVDIKLKYIAPQKVCKYLVKRLGSGTTILEIDSLVNQHSIQFALAGMNVISLCKNQKFIEMGQKNLIAYRVQSQVHQLAMDFLDFKISPPHSFKMIDIIFLNIATLTQIQVNQREICKTIKKALSICENLIILCRSKIINILVIDILCEIMNDEKNSKSIWMEAETIIINEVREYTVYYIGPIANVNEKDFLLEIQKRLLIHTKTFNNYDMTDCLEQIILEVKKKIGPVQLMKIFYEIDQKEPNDKLIKFMNRISGGSILTNQQIDEVKKYNQNKICLFSNINKSKQVSFQQSGNQNTLQQKKIGTVISNQVGTISYSYEMSYDLNFQSELFALPDTFSTNK